jgi:hypothetical protein
MANLLKSAQLLVSDLASTLLFLAVLLITKDLILAVALGVGLGIIQIGWLMARRRPIDTMQWLSIGLVVVSGAATMLTSDARFVMLKPTVIYCIVGAHARSRGLGGGDVALGHREQSRTVPDPVRHDAHHRRAARTRCGVYLN